MVDLDDAGKWTVVVNRRAQKAQRGASNHQHGSSTDKISKSKTKPVLVRSEVDEALVLRRLKRSMDRLKDSEFFSKFVDQTETSPVRDNLFRVGSINERESPSQEVIDGDVVKKLPEDSMVKIVIAVNDCIDTKNNESVECNNPVVVEHQNSSGINDLSIHSREEARRLQNKESTSVVCNNPIEDKDQNVMKSEFGDQCTRSKEDVTQLTRENALCKNVTYNEESISCFRIVLYGVGSIADSEVSRCQLGLVLLMKQRFPWVGEIFVYDPVLSESECNAIEAMGCSLIDRNEEGRHSIDRPTLFYMPHCEDWLYDNVLQANWMPRKLKQLVILGNSFSIYHERWSSFVQSRSKRPPTYVLEFHQNSHEIPLKLTSFMELPAFNDMSWHFYQTIDTCST